MPPISSTLLQRLQSLTGNSRFADLFQSSAADTPRSGKPSAPSSSSGIFEFSSGNGLTPRRPVSGGMTATTGGSGAPNSTFNFTVNGTAVNSGSIPTPVRPSTPQIAPPLAPTPQSPTTTAPTARPVVQLVPAGENLILTGLPPAVPDSVDFPTTAPTARPVAQLVPAGENLILTGLPPAVPDSVNSPTTAPTARPVVQLVPAGENLILTGLPPAVPDSVDFPTTAPTTGPTPIAPAPAGGVASTIDTLRADPDHEAFVVALDATGQSDFVDAQGEVMVLAPTDDAFRALATNTLGLNVEGLSDAEVGALVVNTVGTTAATELIRYHISPEAKTYQDLITRDENSPTDSFAQARITPFAGPPIDVNGGNFSDADPDETDAAFTGRTPEFGVDIETTNGIIHGVDRVLLPNDIDGLGNDPVRFRPIFLNPVF